MYLLVDNYDSFTFNLYKMFNDIGAKVKVIKNDEFIEADDFKGIILSPGPSKPENSGTTLEFIDKYKGKIPIFGVCLGMQAIGYKLGVKIRKAKSIMHGKIDEIKVFKESTLFNKLPENFNAVRYHSLVLDSDINSDFVTSVSKKDNEIMSLEKESEMLFGVQFHPESILSEFGKAICKNFYNYCEDKALKKGKVSLKPKLQKIAENKNLSYEESKEVFSMIVEQKLSDAEVGAILMGLKVKGEIADEIAGAVKVLEKNKISFNKGNLEVIDTCGTGGDGKSCMNVSTAVSIMLASMGLKVVKHGNRAMSGKTGSADILERFGVQLDVNQSESLTLLKEKGFAFLFAQYYHPVLKPIGKIRRQLKIPTLFNFIGPFLNSSNPDYQIIGVSNINYLEILADVAIKLNRNNLIIYSSIDGYDEISSNDITKCIEIKNGEKVYFQISPSDYFKPFEMPKVNSKEEAELMFLRALSNGDPKLTNLLSINCALALKVSGKFENLKDGFLYSKEAIESGLAYKKLNQLKGD